jgi:hypothetical protein
LDPETADRNGDDDADGSTNIEEYLHYRSHLLISRNNDQAFLPLVGLKNKHKGIYKLEQ